MKGCLVADERGREEPSCSERDSLDADGYADIGLAREPLDKIRQGLCVYDGAQRLLLFNRRYAEMYGLRPESLRVGMTLREVIDLRYSAGTGPQMTAEEYGAWRSQIAISDRIVESVVELRNGDVHEIHHEPMPGGGWVATFDDITARRKSETELQASEQRYRALVEASAALVWRADADGSVLGSWGWDEFAGPRMQHFNGRAWLQLVHPDDRDRALAAVKRAARDGCLYEVEYRLQTNAGYRWVVGRGLALKGQDGAIREWVGTVTDVHDRKTVEAALETNGDRLRLALGAGRMVAWEIDPPTGFVTRSENSWELLGLGSGPLEEYMERVHPEDRARVAGAAAACLNGQVVSLEFRYVHPRGDTIWVEVRAIALQNGPTRRLVGVTFDVTERKSAEDRAWRAANHDSLTGLPNRASFQSRLQEALSEADERGQELALVLLDLDDFKVVNDTLGHDAGDALLRTVADRLRSVVAHRGTVARLGGDEFALIITDAHAVQEVEQIAGQVLRDLGSPCEHLDQHVVPRASMGLAVFPTHHRDPAELMKDADMALYAAKAAGRNRAVVYSPTMRTDMERRAAVLRDVREALCEGRIVPYYQPRIRLSTGEVTGFEALARWLHPADGLLTPARFQAAFEDSDLACEIGRQMVEAVARDIATWRAAGLSCGRIAVNLSAHEACDPGLADRLVATLADAGLGTDCLEIEVTETVLLGTGAEQVSLTLDRLHRLGIKIALDDFGTGFASLTHLKRYPVDLIKIDQSFVRDLERDPDDAAIVSALIGLGSSLKIGVVAEGVETEGQAEFLRRNACESVQGFLFAKPMAASRVPWFLANFSQSEGRGIPRSLAG
jgi:diguanylate cyclase (GGDEF)-like protein/PAS domain S-box-containing protein